MGVFSFNRLLFTIALLSASMIAFQLSLMQYLSIVQWHHFAYMVIAIALLGFGAAGTFLALFRKQFIKRAVVIMPLCTILTGIFMPLSIWLSGQDFAGFDTYLLFVERREIWRLFLFELLFFLPFFLCALVIGMAFIIFTGKIGKLYFSNLLGSGIGGLIAILFFWIATPSQIPFFTGLIAIISAFFVLPLRNRFWWIGLSLSLSLLLLILSLTSPLHLNKSQFKSIKQTLDLPDTKVIRASNSPYGWVEYVNSNVLRYAPGLSLAYSGEIPVTHAVFNNGDWAGAMLKTSEDSRIVDFTTSGLTMELISSPKVLVLNASTGIRTQYFAQHNMEIIHHVEAHPLFMDLNEQWNESVNQVIFYNKDARSFLANSRDLYGLISLPDIGAFGGTAGIHAIQEEYNLTLEAFELMFHHLEPDGIISATVWTDYPYRAPLKLTASLIETLKNEGVNDPEKHLIAIRSWNNITYILKKEPFSKEDFEKVKLFCDRLAFDPLILDGISQPDRMQYNQLQDQSLFSLTDKLLSGEVEILYKNYNFNIQPTTDDRPYFSQFLKWKSLPHLNKLYGGQSASFFELGYLIVGVTFLQSLVLAIILIVIPLLWLKRKLENKGWMFLYFAGIGTGFMFIEIVFIQRFILFLGNPVYSLAGVIGTMLLFSGLGSWYSARLKPEMIKIKNIAMLIVLTLLLYTLILPLILNVTLGIPLGFKILLAIILIGFPAFIMGMPFPLGLRHLSFHNDHGVPWAWGLNGCASVVSASLATIVAVEKGFLILNLLGASAYLVTALSCYLFGKINS